MVDPRCDYLPMWSSSEHRCPREALVRILRPAPGSAEPDYRERCLGHAGLGRPVPYVVAYRHPGGDWEPTGLGR
jgi:hypothetical protein